MSKCIRFSLLKQAEEVELTADFLPAPTVEKDEKKDDAQAPEDGDPF